MKEKFSNHVQKKLLLVCNCQFPAQFDGEPVENLSKRREANPKAKSTETAKAGDEVQPSHLWQPLEFCDTHIAEMVLIGWVATHHTLWVPQKRYSQLQCPFRRRCSTLGPDKNPSRDGGMT